MQTSPKVVLFPFLAHGHMSPILELARSLSNHNFLYESRPKDEDASTGRFLSCIEQSNEIVLIRSSRAFEEKYIDFQSVVVDKKMVSLGKGFIEEVWAPQAKILKHPSIGGFLSHCGWGSILESITFGVPIIAMPMQYDQPVNAMLVAEMGIGLEFVREEKGQTKGEDLGRVIEEVMFKDEGKAIFRKSREVRVKSKEEVDIAAQELRRICEKSKTHNIS
ncbi:hypothetical protein LIER_12094 [Lithospermum erythrorhizon]|uniref:Uncharacterized protein n=1 Tax=Lithospermum erythrorhizon TaxID=34254 RepID=A0AAV3PVN1_LITER